MRGELSPNRALQVTSGLLRVPAALERMRWVIQPAAMRIQLSCHKWHRLNRTGEVGTVYARLCTMNDSGTYEMSQGRLG